MMEHLTLRPQHIVNSPLQAAFDAFILSREAMRCTPKTLIHYQYTCGKFVEYLRGLGIDNVRDIKPAHIRSYLVSLQRRGLKDTTQHAHARGIKAWMRWLEAEGDLVDSPMKRVEMPRLEARVPEPFTPDQVRVLLATCDKHTAIGSRDYAMMLTLLDSGLRAFEFTSLRIGDIDMRTGLCTLIGKGRKARQVRVGAKARGAIIRMLGYRISAVSGAPLWVTYNGHSQETGEALSSRGLQIYLYRLGNKTGVKPCSPHRFRRTFALWCLRDGMDLHSLRLLMGHSSLDVLQRYLALAGEDVERAHTAHSPADKLLGG